MATVPSTKSQNARQQLQSTLADFRSDCSQWEDEVTQFFGDLDEFLQSASPSSGSEVSGSEVSGSEASGSPQLTDELAGLRSLVEQQTDVLTALVNALSGDTPPPSAAAPQPADTDEVVDAFLDRVEQLQQMAASADMD